MTGPASFDPSALPCGLISFDDHGLLLDANPTALEWLGLTPAQLPGRTLAELLTPASRLMYLPPIFTRLQQHGHARETYLWLRTRHAGDLPVVMNIDSRTRAGRTEHVAVLMPVTDRKRLEDELLRARRTIEQLPGVVCQYQRRANGQSCFPYVGEAIRDLFGVTPAEARTSAGTVLRCIHPDERAGLRETLRQSARALAPWERQFRIVVDGVERWVEGRFSPQIHEGGLLWNGYLYDVSERKAFEVLQRDKAVAEQANRAKSEFLARVSHELRTPLNAVLGFSQLLSADHTLALDAEHRRQLDHIEAAGRHLLQLINEVLDLARIESGVVEVAIEAVDLAPLLAESLALVELMAAQAGIALHAPPVGGLWAQADRRKLAQSVTNLLTNAIKYNRPAGRVTLAAHAEGEEVVIEVSDSGQGFTPEQLAHVFEPFNRLGAENSRTQGTGLGLAITRALVECQHGELQLDSEPGVGSVFRIRLPRAPHAEPVAEPPPRPESTPDTDAPAPAPLARGDVLYVEDNPVNVVLMESMLALRPGLRLRVASSGAEALAMARAMRPDLFLLDLGLPDMDGLELLRRLRSDDLLRGTPAVAVSADAMSSDIDRALHAGFDGYWTKPLDLASTLRSLDELLLAAR